MCVFVKKRLREFWEKHNDAEQQLKTWYKEASKAKWATPAEVKLEYAKASILKNGKVVFIFAGINTGLS